MIIDRPTPATQNGLQNVIRSWPRWMLCKAFKKHKLCSSWSMYIPVVPHQGGGGSFKNRKPTGEVGCCESGMAERSHWWTEDDWSLSLTLSLSFALFLSLSLSFSDYLPTYLPTYLSISLSLSHLSIYLSIYLPIYLSFYLSLSLSSVYFSIYLSTYLSI